jgi:hypothetical protein
MNRNLVGSIYGRFYIKIAHCVPIRSQTWPPQAILVSDLEDLPCMLSTKFQFIRESGFRGEYVLEINQSETRMACGGQELVYISQKEIHHAN